MDGVTVNLYADSDTNGVPDGGVIDTTTTAGGGAYSFTVTPGSYIVEFVKPAGYNSSPKDNAGDDTIDSDADTTSELTDTITVATGATNNDIDSGMYSPSIQIVKTPATQTIYVNGTAVFTLTVTNTGDVDLDNVSITDATCDTLTGPVGDTLGDGVLPTTETWVYTCTDNNVAADYTNTAQVDADDPLNNNVTDSDTADVDVINPSINIAKTPATQTIYVNGTATFTLTVTNTGDVDLDSVVITDATCNTITLDSGDTGGDGVLTTTETWVYTCTDTVVPADYTNTAQVDADDPLNNNVTDSDTADVMLSILRSTSSNHLTNRSMSTAQLLSHLQ